MTISKCIFNENLAVRNGGGLYVENNAVPKESFELTMEDCEFNKNQGQDLAQSSGTGGGGAYFKDVAVRLDRCKFEQNVGDERGGGIEIINSTVRIFDCKFTENLERQTATSDTQDFYAGGGIFSEGSDVLVANSIFWKNGACNGGGLFFSTNSHFSIINSSIVGNYDTTDHGKSNAHSGGIKVRGDYGASGYVRNCILYGNVSKHYYRNHEYESYGGWSPWLTQICDHDKYCFLEKVTLEMSCVEGAKQNTPGSWLIWDDPAFVNQAAGNLRLVQNSLCIDRGNNYLDWDPLKPGFQLLQETDLDGKPRVIDGNGSGEAEVDMGAYEYQGR